VVRIRKLTKEEELLRKGAMVAIMVLETRREMEKRKKELEKKILELEYTYQDPEGKRGLPPVIERRIEELEGIVRRIEEEYNL